MQRLFYFTVFGFSICNVSPQASYTLSHQSALFACLCIAFGQTGSLGGGIPILCGQNVAVISKDSFRSKTSEMDVVRLHTQHKQKTSRKLLLAGKWGKKSDTF